MSQEKNQKAEMRPIGEIAAKLGLAAGDLELYGPYKAKITAPPLSGPEAKRGRLVMVTAMTPTPAGEGKTTTVIGLVDAMRRLNLRAAAALREPSLGPVFGMKGGATGGGKARVVPSNDINLHFTGDMHAITAAQNLLAAMADNHVHFDSACGLLDPQERHRPPGHRHGRPHPPRRHRRRGRPSPGDRPRDGLRHHRRLRSHGRLLPGPRPEGPPGAPRPHPGRLQSERNARFCLPAQGRGGHDRPAQGRLPAQPRPDARRLARLHPRRAVRQHRPRHQLFGRDQPGPRPRRLGRHGDRIRLGPGGGKILRHRRPDGPPPAPAAVVLVATIRSLKYHGGVKFDALGAENAAALEAGFENLRRHAGIVRTFGVPLVVALNKFPTDTAAEIAAFDRLCRAESVRFALSDVYGQGGGGGIDLAREVLDAADHDPSRFEYLYPLDMPLAAKIETIAKRIYGAAAVTMENKLRKRLDRFAKDGFGGFPVCIAKTQYSLSDDDERLNSPRDFTLTVTDVALRSGAGFVLAQCGDIMTMPGLPRVPSAERIDVGEDGEITGIIRADPVVIAPAPMGPRNAVPPTNGAPLPKTFGPLDDECGARYSPSSRSGARGVRIQRVIRKARREAFPGPARGEDEPETSRL